jgi:hypothetical protein
MATLKEREPICQHPRGASAHLVKDSCFIAQLQLQFLPFPSRTQYEIGSRVNTLTRASVRCEPEAMMRIIWTFQEHMYSGLREIASVGLKGLRPSAGNARSWGVG